MRCFLQLRVRGRGALRKLRLSLTETDKLFMRSSQLEGCAPNPPSPPQKFGVESCLVAGCEVVGAQRRSRDLCVRGPSASLPQPESVPGQMHLSADPVGQMLGTT